MYYLNIFHCALIISTTDVFPEVKKKNKIKNEHTPLVHNQMTNNQPHQDNAPTIYYINIIPVKLASSFIML